MRAIALPAGLGFLFNTLFNLVGSFYAGRWSTDALAALALSFPVFFLIIAASAGFSQATTALVANALGAGRPDDARRLLGQAISMAVALGLTLGLVGEVAAEAAMRLLQAPAAAGTLAVAYLQPVLWAAPAFLLNSCAYAALSSQGDTRTFRDVAAAGALSSAAVIPALMYGWGPLPALGFGGIAAATVVIQVAEASYFWFRVRRSPLGGGLRATDLVPEIASMLRLLRLALPSTFALLATSIGIFVLTGFVASYGPAATAAFGVGSRIEQVVLLPTIGLNAAALALVGHNLGAGHMARVRAAGWTVMRYSMTTMITGAAAVWLLRGPLIDLFTDDPAVQALGASYLGIAAVILPAIAVSIAGAAVLQGLQRPIFPLASNILRLIVLPLALFPLLDGTFGLGFIGLFVMMACINWAAAALTLLYLRWRLAAQPG